MTDPSVAWRSAFALPRWVFLGRGAGSQITPLALEVEGQGVIAVFTTPERAIDFGASLGFAASELEQLVAMPPADAVEYLLQFVEDGVSAAVLDPGVIDAAILLAALPHVQQLSLD